MEANSTGSHGSRRAVEPSDDIYIYCLLFLAPTCFGLSCNHLQRVPPYKYQKNNRNHIKCIIKFSMILSIIKTA